MSDVSELVAKLGELSGASKELYKQYKDIKDREDQVRFELTEALRENGLLTAKTPDFTASIARKQSVMVASEAEAINWVKDNLPAESDHYIGLRTTQFKTMALARLKETGEVIPGTELIESESLSIRANKKKETK